MNALSCGCKVVASDTPPVREMIRDGENGMLVDFFDIDGFVQRSLEVLDRPADHESMGASARSLIETRYSIPVCLQQMQQLYLSVVEQSRGSDKSPVLDESKPKAEITPTIPTETAATETSVTEDWPNRTLSVQLGQRRYDLKYPFSPAMRQVLLGVFQGQEYPLCLPEAVPIETIIDVGANVGAAAIWFHHHFPTARIVCFEPAPTLVPLLRENTQPINTVEVRGVGLSDRFGTAQLHVGKYHSAQSSLVAHEETGQGSETIALRSAAAEIESLNLSRISILKIDTEGSEVPILSDLEHWLDRIDAIYVEYHSEADRRTIDQMLAAKFYLVRAMVRRANLGTLVYLSQPVANGNRLFVSPPLDRSR
jgi:FkbM family methyltransferase